ncbi:cyclopropane fatty acyl phospholipid synthase [Neptunomonas sp.]|uniref:cyclopropane fatty acyl phospholipid synthase n=1 Tax=Neptunomonas TaxID=75687 RepID=UPI0035173E25
MAVTADRITREFSPNSPSTPNHREMVIDSTRKAEYWLAKQLDKAGITLNGSNPWDPQIHNRQVFLRVLSEGSIGIGESYMDGWWDCEQVDELMTRAMTAQLDETLTGRWTFIKHWLAARLMNRQSIKRAFQVGEQHYDAGNDLYTAMLDPTMAYSCGYWQEANSLHEAQLAKLNLVCQKLQLKQDDSVLEIGCGWGSFAELAATRYGAKITGLTISKEQKRLADERCNHLPVDILLQDYRHHDGLYDKLVSIGMFEHVGQKNYDTYMRSAHRLMKDEGIFVLHTIGKDKSDLGTDPWIDKYIFRNGAIPSLRQISAACEPYFVVEDVHNFGQDYDRTLMAWHDNFERAWPMLSTAYDNRFYRMWSYYLKCCAGSFRSRSLQLYQVVLRKRLTPMDRYKSPR